MTDQDKFEKWYASDLEEPLPTEFPIFGKNCLWMGWQAAKQDSAVEIAQLQERLTAYDKWLSEGVYYTTAEAFELHDGYNSKIAQLQADNLKLREALEACKHDCNTGEVIGIAAEALASMPVYSLQARDDEVKHDAARYKYVRCLNPNEFAKICKDNITTGEHFDTLIDRRIHGAGWR